MPISSQTNSTIEYLSQDFSLTSSDIKAMYDTPVLVLPGKGAHTAIFFHMVAMELVWVTPTYTGGSATGQIYFQYGNTNHAGGISIRAVTSIIKMTSSSTMYSYNGLFSITGGPAAVENVGIYVSNPTAAYATGNGTLHGTIYYSIVNTLN